MASAARPFGVAASRDALGPEVARRVRGEMDHETMRINIARAAALVDPPVTIDDLELEAQDYTVMKWPEPLTNLASTRKSRRAAGKTSPLLVAWRCGRGLLF